MNKELEKLIFLKGYRMGLINSSKKLADILSLHGLINKDIKYVFYPEFKKYIKKII